MIKYSAIDWQAFSARKDIEKIANSVSASKEIQLSAFVEVMLVVFGTALSNIFSEDACIRIIWIVILIVSIVIISFPFVSWGYKKLQQLKKGNNPLSPKEAVDLFDNEICYYVMMAEAYLCMYRDRKNEVCAEEAFQKEILRFYYIETSFYLNKAIMELQPICNMANKVFTSNQNTVIINRKIAKVRFDNVCNMIFSLYTQISAFEDCADPLIVNINHQYRQILTNIITMINYDLDNNK